MHPITRIHQIALLIQEGAGEGASTTADGPGNICRLTATRWWIPPLCAGGTTESYEIVRHLRGGRDTRLLNRALLFEYVGQLHLNLRPPPTRIAHAQHHPA